MNEPNVRLEFLNNTIQQCSFDKKSCSNCSNLGVTVLPLGIWWAESRCHYCEDYSCWGDVRSLLPMVEKQVNED